MPNEPICRLDAENPEDCKWITLSMFEELSAAERLASILNCAGINTMVSCKCGAYEYGGCGVCTEGREGEEGEMDD